MRASADHKSRPAEVRGFTYALEPIVKLSQWKLARLNMRLATSQQKTALLNADRWELAALCERSARQIQEGIWHRLDPCLHQANLQHLVMQRVSMASVDRQLEELVRSRNDIRSRILECEVKLEGLRLHRRKVSAEHLAVKAQLDAAEADRDWTMRQAVASSAPPTEQSMGREFP